MHVPAAWYQVLALLEQHLPHLRPAEQRGLAWWVLGTILAHSACQSAVVSALSPFRQAHAARQALREWLYAGVDKAAPCQTQLDVQACFAPLLGWVLRWWQGEQLALAIDATHHRQELVVLVVSVLYRGSAIPVAWHVQPGTARGSWVVQLITLLERVRPAIPDHLTVLVLADRGLWSPRLWQAIRALEAHPLVRVQKRATFQPDGAERVPLQRLAPRPGTAWVGQGRAFKDRPVPGHCTAVVVWAEGHDAPWLLLTDLPPAQVGVSWYGLRSWIEVGFRTLKSLGWHWQRTRRTDPERVSRHWLVLAVATLWTLAVGTRAEEADWTGTPPWQIHTPQPRPAGYVRRTSLMRRGLSWILAQIIGDRWWRQVWLADDPWPPAPAGLITCYHDSS